VSINRFPPEIHGELGYYVYRLIDPRDGTTFYVGKGKGNRVFAHADDELASDYKDASEDDFSLKLRTIRDIRNTGLKPLHVIHRHGLSEAEAFVAEAVLIDATPGLTNLVGGHGSNDRGPCAPEQLVLRYRADVMEFDPQHKVIAINVRRSVQERPNYYHAVRCAWRINVSRARKADLVFAVVEGICRAVFVPNDWVDATIANFPDLEQDMVGRYGFIGEPADQDTEGLYLGKRLPLVLQRRKGMASPILYNYS
jgi:hypothetical protein